MSLRSFKATLVATTILAPMILVGAACAAAPYTISREPLGDALSDLAQASGRNILFSPATVAGKMSAPVSGAADFETALKTLIGGADVAYRIEADGSVTIQPARARADQPAGHKVHAAADGETPGKAVVVTVEGHRLAKAAAAKLAASNTVSVLDSDDIASVPDRNVAETLSRLPGVNVVYSVPSQAGPQGNGTNYGGLDTAARGEGEFVSLRAMNGEYNVNLINGVDVAQGMPFSREVELSLLPPLGVQSIVINKTSTADMNGDAIGGTIDFRMPTAYDFKGPHFGAYLASEYEDRAQQYHLDHNGYTAQIEGSRTFGDHGQFGAYLGAYYQDRHFANSEQTYQSGEIEYQVVTATKGLPQGMNPDQDLQLMTLNMQVATGETKRYGAVASFDWRVSDNISAFLRGTYANSKTDETVYQLGIQGDRTDNGGFAKGEAIGGADGLMRVVSTQTEMHYWAESNPSQDVLSTIQAGMKGQFGHLTVEPTVYYSYGQNAFPNHFETTFYNRANDPAGNVANPGFQRFPVGFELAYNNNYPTPVFTPAELSNIAQLGSWGARNGGEVTDGQSWQSKTGGKVDFTYDVGGPLQFVKFGASVTGSKRFTSFRDFESDAAVAKGTTLANSGLVGDTVSAIIPGIYTFAMPLVSADRFWAAFNRNNGFNVTWSPDDYNGNTVKGTENVSSAYVMGNLKFDDVEVIPGLRFEHTDVKDTYWNSGNNGVDKGGVHYGWTSSQSQFDEALPSVLVNWRPAANTVYRAGVWTSYTRPPFIELAGNTSTNIDSDGNIHISEGNPDLKAIRAVNVDASGNWVNSFGGAASVSLYYKNLSNYIYNGGGNFTTVSTQTGAQTSISKPLNGGDGHIYGIELDVRQMFPSLPGFWSGFGVSGNATFQASQVDLKNPLLKKNERMQNAPSTLLNATLLYRKYGLVADLSYHYSSDYIEAYGLWGTTSFGSPFNSSALDQWVHAHSQVDLNLAYNLPHNVELRFTATNLTNAVTFYDTIGRRSPAAPEIIEGGRTYQLAVRYAF